VEDIMSGELQRYSTGAEVPAKIDRAVSKKAKKIYDEVRLQGFKAEGATALAGHIMEQAVSLNERRQALSQGDPVTEALLTDIQMTAMRELKKVQSSLFNDWNL
jgi:hypothetical protein